MSQFTEEMGNTVSIVTGLSAAVIVAGMITACTGYIYDPSKAGNIVEACGTFTTNGDEKARSEHNEKVLACKQDVVGKILDSDKIVVKGGMADGLF